MTDTVDNQRYFINNPSSYVMAYSIVAVEHNAHHESRLIITGLLFLGVTSLISEISPVMLK